MRRARPGSAGSPRGRGREGTDARSVTFRPAPAAASTRQKSDKARTIGSAPAARACPPRLGRAPQAHPGASLVTGGLGAAGWAGWRAFENNGFLAFARWTWWATSWWARPPYWRRPAWSWAPNLPPVPVGSVEASLHSLPGVDEVDVQAYLPVAHRDPRKGKGTRGHGISPAAGTDWRPMVRASPAWIGADRICPWWRFAGLDSSARAALGGFLESARARYPDLYANFSQMSPRGIDGVEIILRDRKLKVLLPLERAASGGNFATSGSNKSLISLEFLRALQQQQAASLESGKTVDLRVEGFAYVR